MLIGVVIFSPHAHTLTQTAHKRNGSTLTHISKPPPPSGLKRESAQAKRLKRESDSGLSAVSHLGVSLGFRPGAQISSGHNRDSY